MGKRYRETSYVDKIHYTAEEWNYYCQLRNEYVASYNNGIYSYQNGDYYYARGCLYQAKMALYEICMNCPLAAMHNNEYKRAWKDIPKLIDKAEMKIQEEEMCA